MGVQYLSREILLPTTSGEINEIFTHDHWQMTDAERSTLVAMLSELRPECAIELGTYRGGSLGVISRYCAKVYALDIDPSFRNENADRFPNVEFVIGDSRKTITSVLNRIQKSGEKLEFVLIDGNHEEPFVREDINQFLAYRPMTPCYVIMHDSFNPGCRRGIASANWAQNKHVHLVEMDFVSGRIFPRDDKESFRDMWCGFALAILLPEERKGDLIIRQNGSLNFKSAYWFSKYPYQRLWNPFHSIPRLMRRIKS